ncbi:hypothetical protein GH714_018135 [Hevea brasiliensis]|uniref:Uncharacterized protein n=1 Tax=Hevea brasiliensis TaxID=3981 RepID=A0A6A6N589_HEVBR|nr:hypothetical protein GH714_018135 [Hevea brasiliensis]
MAEARRNPLWVFSVLLLLLVFAFCFLDAKLDTKAHSSGLDVDNERLKWASSTYKLENSAIPPKDIPISQPTKSIHNLPPLHFVMLPKGSVPPSGGEPPIHNPPEIKNLNFGMLPKGPVPHLQDDSILLTGALPGQLPESHNSIATATYCLRPCRLLPVIGEITGDFEVKGD